MSYLNFNSDEFFNDTLKNLNNISSKTSYEVDPDDWYPQVDKSGNSLSVVRLLPPLENEKVPIVKWYSHNFKNPANNKWYIENSLKSLNESNDDPVAEYNKKLWNSTDNDDHPNRKQARNQKRNVNYRVNVYIISDSSTPENNGKIKKFRFGKTFFDIINLAMNPPKIEGIQEEKPLNPFDLIRGADLKIQIFSEKRGGKIQRNYSKSVFKTERTPLFNNHKDIESLYKLFQSESEKWSLLKYIAPNQFKDYEVLLKRLNLILEIDTKTGKKLNTSHENQNIPKENPKEQKSQDKEDDMDFEKLLKNDVDDDIPF